MDINQFMSKMKSLLQHTLFQVLLFVILGLVSYLAMLSNVIPEKIDVELFKVSDETIRSPKTVEDTEKTNQEKEEARKQVPDEYTLKKEYAQNRVDLISSIFDSVIDVKKESEGKEEDRASMSAEEKSKLLQKEVSLLKKKLTDDVNNELSDDVYRNLLKANVDELKVAKDVTVTAINSIMSNKIPANEVENSKKMVENELQFTSMNSDAKKGAIDLGRFAVTQNYFFDPQKTEEKRDKAVEDVEPVKILQGAIIVEKGQLIDQNVYRNLKLAGVLDSDKSLMPYIGLAMLVAFVFGFMFYFYRIFEKKNEHRHSHILIFSLVYIITLFIIKMISLLGGIETRDLSYFIPVAMGTMLLKILLDDRYAITLTLILSIFGAVIFNDTLTSSFNVTIAFYILLSGVASILIISTKNLRSKIFQAGILLSLIHVVIIFSLSFIMDVQMSRGDYLFYVIAAFVSGLSAAVLTIGLLPFFEAGFGILSTMKLIELSNPNHPLLRKILTEAPGTYHHSVMVANLSEAACEAIGANGLLARVGSYYHDLGKTRRPQFFIENQMNMDNPHDKLRPETSRDIIIAHATDGAKMLRKEKMPKEIVDIAEQHHGTTFLKFFYYKAKEMDDQANEDDFRYKGPKPQTKEIAVISIADSVEAAVRSMKQPTREKIESLVKSIIHDRINDDQFTECDITMQELDKVEKTLCETMNGFFHSRIEYPDSKNESK
ncbi:HD family phosphohydrolase [Bacillus sp. 1P06AnD]|uniref:HD family phosphohydrolase n=1 Tax=Bacillus sp. 1P06AnD TaxID=3132208 RepID=UPI0039A13F62